MDEAGKIGCRLSFQKLGAPQSSPGYQGFQDTSKCNNIILRDFKLLKVSLSYQLLCFIIKGKGP